MKQVDKYTLMNAIAWTHITGAKQGLQVSTRLAVMDYEKPYISGGPLYTINDAGLELAAQSRSMKVHNWLIAAGFELKGERRRGSRILKYQRADGCEAFTCYSWGTAYGSLDAANPRDNQLLCKFKNGAK